MNRQSLQRKAPETVSGYRFDRSHLRVDQREPGISAFMRIRNGAEFLELTIRSHIEFFDEIVAVHNNCTDETPQILTRLQEEFGPQKLRVIHYADEVFPPGSSGHIRTDPHSPHSLVNYYNFALASTRYRFATKLDDDHLAIRETTRRATDSLRSGETDPKEMLCFSGLNLFHRPDGSLAVLKRDPISGSGDIGFFRVTPNTYFSKDRRFERFRSGGARRRFCGFLYWHLKYLKSDMGFGNYRLDKNPTSRYAKRHAAMHQAPPECLDLQALAHYCSPTLLHRLKQLVSSKQALIGQRNATIPRAFPDAAVAQAVERTAGRQFRSALDSPQTEHACSPTIRAAG
ncbi:glycosyltransferase family A protein [Candidatus Laterigemmans baculatus]|uniref:glycosyltransferase family A protein n=1 Tax=Candidatus Laterigemmans baculatus TaxID=2770505 RepID=UPI001F3D93EB|nr:glycosyltransferase family A protein [Candidatus Laterigemmans baculatus]